MNVFAISKSVTVSPRKVRLVAASLRNRSVKDATAILAVVDKRGGAPLKKTLKSAVANAINNNKLQLDKLFVTSVDVLEGTSLKRFHPSTRGRVHPYKKRTSHIKITVSDIAVKKEAKNGTKS